MKAQILKIAGVKNEKEFYKKFPTEEAFMKKHGKELKKAQGGASVNGADFFGNTTSNYGYDPNASNSFVEAVGKAKGGSGKGSDLSGMLAPLAGTLIGGIQDINQTSQDIKKMKGYANISDVVAKAAKTRPDSVKKKIDYNSMRSQTVNPLGVGTNYLAAKNGAEIQNTYDPLDIYAGLGYEPLNDSNVKQFADGGGLNLDPFSGIAGTLGGNLGSATGKGTGRGGAASSIGSSLGAVAGNALLPGVGGAIGSLVGGFAGGLIDAGQQNELQMAQDKLTSNLNKATLQSGAQAFQSQNSSFMEDGGWVSNDWMPQVITKFGDYNMDELLAPPHDADMLRAGGHLKEYTPPSARAMFTGRRDLPYQMEDGGDLPSTNMMFDTDRYPSAKYGTSMAMGGDLRTTWGGEAEPISYNPYLPGTGQTVMFRGQSHDETNSDGQSGIGVKYGTGGMMDYAEYGSETPSADVEVERNEPAAVLKDPETGGDNLVVYGNMVIPNYGVEELGDPKAKGKKFKNYVADLSKVEARQNKIIDKSTSMVDSMDVVTAFDKLALQSAQANIMGATAKLKNIADKKVLAAGVQNAILDTAKEHGIVADDLAKGKIVKDKEAMKEARFGAKMETAQKGKTIKYDPEFENFIDQAMMLEQANSAQAGDYRGGGSNFGTNDSSLNTPEKAKEYYYNNYWSKVKDLPAGLRTRALQMAINTGDPYGELMVAAGKMGIDKRRDTKDQRKDKAITGNKDWEASKADILKAYKEDPQGFLGKLDSEQNRYYDSLVAANTKGGKTFGSINPDTSREFYNDYMGLARYASQPYIGNSQPAVAPIAAASTSTPMATNTPLVKSTSPTELWQIPKGERKAIAIANGIKNYSGTKAQNKKLMGILNQSVSAPAQSAVSPMTAAASNTPSFFGNTGTSQQANLSPSDLDQYIPQGYPGSPSVVESPNKKAVKKELADSPWFDIANTALQSAYPFIRSTSQQSLDPSQIGPEMMALGLNALEPVQAQLYNPTPQAQPYRVSLQDQRNEVIAQQRAASKMAYGNPAAASMIAAQASDALNKINAEEFRANQAETMRAAEANRALLNDAQLKNLGILDQQYARQAESKSKTKTQAIEIAKSVAEKIQQNKLENRKQAIMENMYPAFSFTKSGIAYKDPRYTTTFNPYGSSKKSDANIPEGFEPTYKKDETGNYVLDKLEKKKVSRNGAIVKAIKGL